MCNLYDVGPPLRPGHTDLSSRVSDWVEERKATYVAPGKPGLVLLPNSDEWETHEMSWGFPPKRGPINNSRDDRLESWQWKQSWHDRRCVIPVLRFFGLIAKKSLF